jgi:hypothetical protein
LESQIQEVLNLKEPKKEEILRKKTELVREYNQTQIE